MSCMCTLTPRPAKATNLSHRSSSHAGSLWLSVAVLAGSWEVPLKDVLFASNLVLQEEASLLLLLLNGLLLLEALLEALWLLWGLTGLNTLDLGLESALLGGDWEVAPGSVLVWSDSICCRRCITFSRNVLRRNGSALTGSSLPLGLPEVQFPDSCTFSFRAGGGGGSAVSGRSVDEPGEDLFAAFGVASGATGASTGVCSVPIPPRCSASLPIGPVSDATGWSFLVEACPSCFEASGMNTRNLPFSN